MINYLQNNFSLRSIAQAKTPVLLKSLGTAENGLAAPEALRRQHKYGPNQLRASRLSVLSILWRQITINPLALILIVAAGVSFATGDRITAYYVVAMIAVSISLGFWNEFSAARTVAALMKKISLLAIVYRDGIKTEISVTELTIGDIIFLMPGNIVPADLRLIEADNLEINEADLTGESFGVGKTSHTLEHEPTAITQMRNSAFMGTEVISGTGTGVVVAIGRQTEFGKIADTISFVRPPTQFQKGLTSFGSLLAKVIFALTIIIFAVNAFLGRELLTSLLFALAVAVGLTPELLPVVVTVGLAHGAGKLAKRKVIIKQLIAIENLGNMDILCADKTGTLTEGKIRVIDLIDSQRRSNTDLLELALLANTARFHHKFIGPSIDIAVQEYARIIDYQLDGSWKLLKNEPFNYEYGFAYALAQRSREKIMIIHGAPEKVLARCQAHGRKGWEKRCVELSRQGYRLTAIATKRAESDLANNERGLKDFKFCGFILLSDLPKQSVRHALDQLARLNVVVKIVTGDNELVAQAIAKEVGMTITHVMTGEDLNRLAGIRLKRLVEHTDLFARVSPEQKLRIIEALQSAGHTVGYLGDGINDAPALHAADVGISVNSAIDVAKEAAQVVLLHKSLDVLAAGIEEGRRTFMNVIKYILMGTGSNFGEMLSAAGASFFLPFLPMTPVQILLENGLYDASQIPITSDRVDQELLTKPKNWSINLIYRFMLFFGLLSAAYTVVTFVVMLGMFHASVPLFRTAWFLESLTTEMVVVLTVRTTRVPFFRSLPSRWLILTCLLIVVFGLWLPFSPLALSLGFVPPPNTFFVFLISLILSYMVIIELFKKHFVSKFTI